MSEKVGIKYDQGKPRLELLPPSYWRQIDVSSPLSIVMADWFFYNREFPKNFGYDAVSILEFGAQKYADHNWFRGMKWSRLVGAFHRHVNFFDEDYGLWVPRDLQEKDDESSEPHGKHAECCRLFLQEYYLSDIGENDAPWGTEKI